MELLFLHARPRLERVEIENIGRQDNNKKNHYVSTRINCCCSQQQEQSVHALAA
jgi:hypothetical protein